ncbi:ficolin-2-like [Watersipora subatra]|uniref:ficolin-2-like n=1 Tax=Watersipora subatra TaxID=2589382 RepID=UPI00355C1CD7
MVTDGKEFVTETNPHKAKPLQADFSQFCSVPTNIESADNHLSKDISSKLLKAECPDLNGYDLEPSNENTTLLKLEMAQTTLSSLLLTLSSCRFDAPKRPERIISSSSTSDVELRSAATTKSATTALSIGKDCQDHYEHGSTSSGVYLIDPPSSDLNPFKVWCDFFDGHGWTAFQKRFDGSIVFYQDWLSYKQGFGNITGEYWLGLDKIHALTQTNRRLNIVAKSVNGTTKSGTWSSFIIGSEGDNYKLNRDNYKIEIGEVENVIHGNEERKSQKKRERESEREKEREGEGKRNKEKKEQKREKKRVSSASYNGSLVEFGMSYSNGMSFSTKDRDNDEWNGYNCARNYHGAWWYKRCHRANLNGGYNNVANTGFYWSYFFPLKESVMRVSRD